MNKLCSRKVFETIKNKFKNSSRTYYVHKMVIEIIKNTFKNSSRTPESTQNSRSHLHVQEQFMKNSSTYHKFLRSCWTVLNLCSWTIKLQVLLNSSRILARFQELFLNCSWVKNSISQGVTNWRLKRSGFVQQAWFNFAIASIGKNNRAKDSAKILSHHLH